MKIADGDRPTLVGCAGRLVRDILPSGVTEKPEARGCTILPSLQSAL